ncbi:PEP-CTERM sorting domain-containing protein [Nostoc sp. UHCC 0302]|uniref:PEP-CTERM sorting domain-containing protein n=1 Tax=Nostoc sp. UHCC 0302 TaxID=3134896 RepID=UPI00311CC578
MKLQQFASIGAIVLATILFMSDKSQAFTIIRQDAKLATPALGTPVIGESSDAGLSKPGDVATLSYTPSSSSSVYAKNDSTYNFTKFIYTILPGQDAFWDAASTFDFFSSSEVSADGKTLTLSDGVFSAGATALFSAVSLTNDPLNARTPTLVNVTFDGTPVPEPMTIIGTLAAGAFGVALKRKKLALTK